MEYSLRNERVAREPRDRIHLQEPQPARRVNSVDVVGCSASMLRRGAEDVNLLGGVAYRDVITEVVQKQPGVILRVIKPGDAHGRPSIARTMVGAGDPWINGPGCRRREGGVDSVWPCRASTAGRR